MLLSNRVSEKGAKAMAVATKRLYTVRKFTVEEYYKLAEVGILSEDDRVELIEGEIVVHSPIGSRHAACVKRLNALFSSRAQNKAIVSVQDPIRLSEHSEPQPDLALLKPHPDFYAEEHPSPQDVLLIIEVTETSLEYDKSVKLPLYAKHGIPEVWLVDLAQGRMEVHRKPQGERYMSAQKFKRDQTIAPEALPEVKLAVDEILG